MRKLSSLTIFFPFLNDEGTVEKAISDAYFYGKRVSQDLEIIAIHGGKSSDDTLEKIKDEKRRHSGLIIIDKTDNKEGYAVIKHGFYKASKDWVFYSDGDLQYHLDDLEKLVEEQERTGADVINGYKTGRGDNFLRNLAGTSYSYFSKLIFDLPIRDVDCDFRLIRRSFFDKFKLEERGSSILPELIKKLEKNGARFSEVLVKHSKRTYGKSNYNIISLTFEKLLGDLKLRLKEL